MITTIDRAGRIVLPKAIRDRARLAPGIPLDVRVVGGTVEIEPARAPVTVQKKGGLWVAAPASAMPVLTQDQVDAAVDAVRVPPSDALVPKP